MNPFAWMLVAIAIFVLGLLVGMAMQRASYKHALESVGIEEDLTDWENDD